MSEAINKPVTARTEQARCLSTGLLEETQHHVCDAHGQWLAECVSDMAAKEIAAALNALPQPFDLDAALAHVTPGQLHGEVPVSPVGAVATDDALVNRVQDAIEPLICGTAGTWEIAQAAIRTARDAGAADVAGMDGLGDEALGSVYTRAYSDYLNLCRDEDFFAKTVVEQHEEAGRRALAAVRDHILRTLAAQAGDRRALEDAFYAAKTPRGAIEAVAIRVAARCARRAREPQPIRAEYTKCVAEVIRQEWYRDGRRIEGDLSEDEGARLAGAALDAIGGDLFGVLSAARALLKERESGFPTYDDWARLDDACHAPLQRAVTDMRQERQAVAALCASEAAALRGQMEALVSRWRSDAAHLGEANERNRTMSAVLRICGNDLAALLTNPSAAVARVEAEARLGRAHMALHDANDEYTDALARVNWDADRLPDEVHATYDAASKAADDAFDALRALDGEGDHGGPRSDARP